MAWGGEIGSKVSQKTIFLPVSAHFFFLSLSIVAFSHHHPHQWSSHYQLHHRKPTQPPADHQKPPSVFFLLAAAPPACFFLLPAVTCSQLQPPATISVTASATVSTTNRPPSSHRGLLSFLLPAFVSPLQLLLLLLLCFSAIGHRHLSRSPLSRRTDIPSTTADPHHIRWFSSLRRLLLLRRGRCMQNSFLHAAIE